jgi:hypothetical protein
MPENKADTSMQESAKFLQGLREKLADVLEAMYAIDHPYTPQFRKDVARFLNEMDTTEQARLTDDFMEHRMLIQAIWGKAAAESSGDTPLSKEAIRDALKMLADAKVSAGRLDALLEQMQRTDQESQELLDRSARIRERLKAAAS